MKTVQSRGRNVVVQRVRSGTASRTGLFGPALQTRAIAAPGSTQTQMAIPLPPEAGEAVASSVSEVPMVSAIGPNRTDLPDRLKSGLEILSGLDLSDVRVHRNSASPAQLGALAFARGYEIHLGPGQERHLPHEAWHVVQQRQGRVRERFKLAGLAVNADPSLEHEAELMGKRADQMNMLISSGRGIGRHQPPNAIPDDGPATQLMQHESIDNRSSRKIITGLELQSVSRSGTNDPSFVSVLLFSREFGMLYYLPAKTTRMHKKDNDPPPDHSYAKIRFNNQLTGGNKNSKDGEMYQIPLIIQCIEKFVTERQSYFSQNGNDEIRIEFIGPRGTCQDCEEAMRQFVEDQYHLYNEIFDNLQWGGVIKFSARARWTGDAQMESKNRGNDRAGQYGTDKAIKSEGPALKVGNVTRFDAPHWKNII